jgi:hypothetical protein
MWESQEKKSEITFYQNRSKLKETKFLGDGHWKLQIGLTRQFKESLKIDWG